MPEPTNPGQPSDSSTERGSPVNVETSGNVTVTRKDVATGEVKDLQADLLRELIACCKDHTKTLKDVIVDTKNEVHNVVDEAKKQNSDGKKGGSGVKWQEAMLEMNRNIRSLLSKSTGGSGGGKANLAQAGGKYKDKIDEALRLVKSLV